jgi:hypothetical protein
MLKTAIARASIVLFFLIFIATTLYGYSTIRIISPTEWYGYSQGSEAGIDIRSPTRLAISAITFLPKPTYSPIVLEEYTKRCGSLEREPVQSYNKRKYYRGVLFCNGAALTGESLEQSYNYFIVQIDNLYSSFYGEHFGIILTSFGLSFAGILFLLLASRIVRWVRSGA